MSNSSPRPSSSARCPFSRINVCFSNCFHSALVQNGSARTPGGFICPKSPHPITWHPPHGRLARARQPHSHAVWASLIAVSHPSPSSKDVIPISSNVSTSHPACKMVIFCPSVRLTPHPIPLALCTVCPPSSRANNAVGARTNTLPPRASNTRLRTTNKKDFPVPALPVKKYCICSPLARALRTPNTNVNCSSDFRSSEMRGLKISATSSDNATIRHSPLKRNPSSSKSSLQEGNPP